MPLPVVLQSRKAQERRNSSSHFIRIVTGIFGDYYRTSYYDRELPGLFIFVMGILGDCYRTLLCGFIYIYTHMYYINQQYDMCVCLKIGINGKFAVENLSVKWMILVPMVVS